MQREKGRPGSMRNILERLKQNTSASPVDTSVQSTSSAEANIQSSVDASIASSLSSISIPDYVSEVKEKAPPKKKERRISGNENGVT